ncbi:MAG: hypothetical protein U0359_40795 [Byssovorax sp.]
MAADTAAPAPPRSQGEEPGFSTPIGLADHLLSAACLLIILFCLLQILTFGYGRDQGIYAMAGKIVLQGGMPYRDAWDFKPPGIFLIYAASRAVFGAEQGGIRITECLGLAAMIGAMAHFCHHTWGNYRIGLCAGAIAALAHAQLDFWHTAQPESFGGMVTIFALIALGPGALSGLPRGDRPALFDKHALRRFALSGALFGFAGLLKPPLAGGGAVVAVALAVRAFQAAHRPKAPLGPAIRAAIRPILAVAAGGIAPLLLCALWFAARGALGSLWDVLFVFTPHYTALSWVGETLGGMVYWGFTEWLTAYSSVPTVGLFLFFIFQPRRRERFGAMVIGALIALHIAGVVMQGKFFPYHYGATWPLTALLGGLGFFRVFELFRRFGAAGSILFITAASSVALGRTATHDVEGSFRERCRQRIELFSHRPRDQAAIDKLASVADVNAGANRAVATYLRDHIPADRPVFVWGFEPVIYDLADRRPATRYLYDVPQRVAWAKQKERAVLMDDLRRSVPAAIVVEHRDVFPMVTGDAIDSADTLANFGELRDLLNERYRIGMSIEDFDIYVERRGE